MKPVNRIRVTLLALLSAVSVCAISSTLREKSAPTAKLKLAPEFQVLYAKFSDGFAARDIDALMSVFDRDVVLSYQNSPDLSFDEIQAGFEHDFENDPPGTGWKGFPEESLQNGDLAVVIAHWEYHVTRNGAAVMQQRIRSVDVLKRSDGKWKIVRTINYPDANG